MPLAFSLPPDPLSSLTSTGQTTVNPPLSPPRDLFIQAHLRGGGGLMETGGLFNLESTMVSVLHKEV